MTLMEQIKSDRNEAKRESDAMKTQVLTTLLSEIQRLDKKEQEDDGKIIAVANKYVKCLDEMIEKFRERPYDSETMEKNVMEEREIVSAYLPKQLAEDELEHIIASLVEDLDVQSAKEMGKVMKCLKEKFDGRYDGKLASQLVRKVIAGQP